MNLLLLQGDGMSYEEVLKSSLKDLRQIHEGHMAQILLELSSSSMSQEVMMVKLHKVSSYAWEQLHLGKTSSFV